MIFTKLLALIALGFIVYRLARSAMQAPGLLPWAPQVEWLVVRDESGRILRVEEVAIDGGYNGTPYP